ncbi:MAG: hypothetical protein IJI38_02140 [Clostridia bacterium]|nr:hypothetical protein [Clostridia bacterium]
MASVGSMKVLLGNVESVFPERQGKPASARPAAASVETLLEAGRYALEDGEWERARKMFQTAAETERDNPEAYIGLLLSENEMPTRDMYYQAVEKGKIDADDEYLEKAEKAAVKTKNMEVLKWCAGVESAYSRIVEKRVRAEEKALEIKETLERENRRENYASSDEFHRQTERVRQAALSGTGAFQELVRVAQERNELDRQRAEVDPLFPFSAVLIGAGLFYAGIGLAYILNFGFPGAWGTVLRVLVIAVILLAAAGGLITGGLTGAGIWAGLAVGLMLLGDISGWICLVPGTLILLYGLFLLIRGLKNLKRFRQLDSQVRELEGIFDAGLKTQIEDGLKAGYLREFGKDDPEAKDLKYQETAGQLCSEIRKAAFKQDKKDR